MIILFVLLPLCLLLVLLLVAGVYAFHWGVGNGHLEDLDTASWDGLFGAEQCKAKQRDDV